jgi:hypothetical protein
MEKEENYELIEKIIISIDGIYKMSKIENAEIGVFISNKKLIDDLKVNLITISQFAKKIDIEIFEKKDFKVIIKLVSFNKYSDEKPSNIKNLHNLIFSRELSLINIRLVEIQNEKFGKPIDKIRLVLMKKINKNMRFAFKTMY